MYLMSVTGGLDDAYVSYLRRGNFLELRTMDQGVFRFSFFLFYPFLTAAACAE